MNRRAVINRIVRMAEAPGGDVEALKAAIELEDQAVFTYGKAAGLGVLSAAQVDLSEAHLADHETHRQVLADTVASLGGEPPQVKDVYPIIGDTKSAKGFLSIAVALEESAVQAAFAGIRTLSRADLRHTLASILGVEAQHVVVLRGALDLTPLVPHPFVDQGLQT